MTNQELLRDLKANSYPHLKKESQTKTHRSVMKLAYPEMFRKAQAIKTDDLKLV